MTIQPYVFFTCAGTVLNVLHGTCSYGLKSEASTGPKPLLDEAGIWMIEGTYLIFQSQSHSFVIVSHETVRGICSCKGLDSLRLERAREGRSVTRGALGSAWVVAAVMLHAFEYILSGTPDFLACVKQFVSHSEAM